MNKSQPEDITKAWEKSDAVEGKNERNRRRIREAQRVGESGKRSIRLSREQKKDVGEAGERMVRGFAGNATGGAWGGQRQRNRKSYPLAWRSEGGSSLDCWAREEILWETGTP